LLYFFGQLKPSADSITNSINVANCVVNALVDATPISGPARVINTRSDSLTNELSGTLQIATEYLAPSFLASFSAPEYQLFHLIVRW